MILRIGASALLTFSLFNLPVQHIAAQTDVDIVVYGGTSAGVIAEGIQKG
jgi:hypothetical protein